MYDKKHGFNTKLYKNEHFERITPESEAMNLLDWLDDNKRSEFFRLQEVTRVIKEAEERGVERYLVLKGLEQQ